MRFVVYAYIIELSETLTRLNIHEFLTTKHDARRCNVLNLLAVTFKLTGINIRNKNEMLAVNAFQNFAYISVFPNIAKYPVFLDSWCRLRD